MILVGIMGAAAVVSMNSIPSSRHSLAARQVQSDLVFARERAMATGIRHWVAFSVSTNSYSLLAEDPLNPGRAGAMTITDPAKQGPFVQRLNINEFTGATFASAVFDAGTEVGFDWLGEPLSAVSVPLAASGTVTISGNHRVIVQSGTGMVTHEGP